MDGKIPIIINDKLGYIILKDWLNRVYLFMFLIGA